MDLDRLTAIATQLKVEFQEQLRKLGLEPHADLVSCICQESTQLFTRLFVANHLEQIRVCGKVSKLDPETFVKVWVASLRQSAMLMEKAWDRTEGEDGQE